MNEIWVRNIGGMIGSGENRITGIETWPSATFSTKNPTSAGLGSIPIPCSLRPTVNDSGTSKWTRFFYVVKRWYVVGFYTRATVRPLFPGCDLYRPQNFRPGGFFICRSVQVFDYWAIFSTLMAIDVQQIFLLPITKYIAIILSFSEKRNTSSAGDLRNIS